MILYCFAVDFEASAFDRAGLQSDSGKLLTGVGRDSVCASVAGRLEAGDVTLLVSSGFAGAVRPGWVAGDSILAQNRTSPDVLEKLAAVSGAPWRIGRVENVNRVVNSVAERESIADSSGADVVDMESDAIWQIGEEKKIPVVTLRSISDGLDNPLPVPPSLLGAAAAGTDGILQLTAFLIRHPMRILPFVRFVRGCNRARKSLAVALARADEILRKTS